MAYQTQIWIEEVKGKVYAYFVNPGTVKVGRGLIGVYSPNGAVIDVTNPDGTGTHYVLPE